MSAENIFDHIIVLNSELTNVFKYEQTQNRSLDQEIRLVLAVVRYTLHGTEPSQLYITSRFFVADCLLLMQGQCILYTTAFPT